MTEKEKKEIIEYIEKNVWEYESRCSIANETIDRYRCSLEGADYNLWCDMKDALSDWCYENDKNPEDYDLEEIFF